MNKKSLKIPKSNQNSHTAEEQTTQWPNEKKDKRTNNEKVALTKNERLKPH
jgi:hypothetical protein